MRFKISNFSHTQFCKCVNELKETLMRDYVELDVSVKYISKSGSQGVTFVSVTHDQQIIDSYTRQPIDFDKLAQGAVLDFKIAS